MCVCVCVGGTQIAGFVPIVENFTVHCSYNETASVIKQILVVFHIHFFSLFLPLSRGLIEYKIVYG